MLPIPLMAREYAAGMFALLLERLAVSDTARRNLVALWHEPHRRYHAAGHAGVLWHRHLAHGGDPDDAVIAHALAYHDAIYTVGARDNEARSAALWRSDAAGLPVTLRDPVDRAIMATANHAGEHPDEVVQWMVDLDLSPLGEPWPLFEANTQALIDEAGAACSATVLAGQQVFFGTLARLPVLYRSRRHSRALARTYEVTARENMTRVLAR
ncbi:MAG: hypothetical protein AB7F35_11805 [Acetobacteraceae bacterium]